MLIVESKVLKWVLISIGILLGLALIGGVLLWLTLTGTFIRWGDSPVLLRELKNTYSENFVIYDYEEEYSGILDISHFSYRLHPRGDSDIRFEIEFEEKSLSKEQLGTYALAYANSEITKKLKSNMVGYSAVYNTVIDYGVASFGLSEGISNEYKEKPVDFVNSLGPYRGTFNTRSFGVYYGLYDSIVCYPKDYNRGEAVKSLVDSISAIGLTNYSIDLAFVSDDELSVFNENYKNKKSLSLYSPDLNIVNRGDVYRIYRAGYEVYIHPVSSYSSDDVKRVEDFIAEYSSASGGEN